MSTKRYQILGDIVTGAQLDEKLKKYVPTDENSETVSWVEVVDGKVVVTMKDGKQAEYEVGSPKDFSYPEYDTETGYLHFYNEAREDVYDPVYIGGGQGTGTGTSVRLTNQNGTTTLVGSHGSAITLMFTFTSIEDDLETGNGTCKIAVNGVTKHTTSIPQGLNAIDVAPYLNAGTNTVKVTCIDTYGVSKSLTYSVTVIQLLIESSFNAAVAYNSDITFKYTPYGAIEKTVHFLVDGNDAGTVVTSLSGKQLTKTFSKMSHGVHRLEVYSTAMIDETEISSPSLVYDIICTEDGDTTPMIASVYEVESIEQGAMVSIPYIIYDPLKLACDVTLTIYTMDSGSEVIYATQTITVDRSQQVWNTRKYPIGTVYFKVAYSGDIYKTHTVTVAESSIKVEPETNDLELQLSSEGRSNNETNPGRWVFGDVATSFTAMNWASTGWVSDENGDTCLRLNGDARAEIAFQPFASDLRTYGKTIELEFAIRDVHNRNAVPISCMSGGIGFEVKPDTTYLKSELSEVFCNYKDDERVKVTFVLESKDESRLLSIYLNGVRSDAVQYPSTDNFQQTTPVNISIGSSDCGIDIYNIRSYSTALTSEGVANNFIADITDIVRKTEAFEDNDIYDEFGEVSYSKAMEKNSVMVIVGGLPASKGDKKKVRIEYYDVEDSNLNFSEDDVTIDVQGTSSQWYVRKNWKLKFAENHYIDFDQLPAKVICIKVDYAEATGTHNTQNANFVERLYSEKTPAQLVDPKCRSTIYGKPILLFHQADSTSDPVFYGKSNFNYDKGAEYVFGFTDKFDVECWEFKNNTSDACNFLGPVPEIWVDDFEARYPEETTEIGRFREMHNWVVSTRRDTATGNALAEPYTDANGGVHTHDTAEYRLEKFKMEFENYFNMHFMLVYYVYTFFALMVDQRAKNMFLTYWGEEDRWSAWFYDNDTCFGINNEGQLVLDYYHEDTDQLEGANVYNGQKSVLWCNFRDAFPDKIKETYQDLRSNGVLNYDEMREQFITKGSDKWSESIYNEDADFKYISMLYSDNDASNLGQVRGTGEEHLEYFLENRFNYCDGKWYAPDYADDYVALRIYTPVDENGAPRTDLAVAANADITVTPYSYMYAGLRYKANGTLQQKRVSANEVTTFEAPNETFNDTETAIYGASQLSSLGDLSPLYCGSINVSKATKLTELIIGNDTEGYSNPNLNDLSVGTNNLLKVINVRNCPKLTDPLALAGCPNIEEIYAAGSAITGIDLANSGYLKVIELPATIANLTLKNQLYVESLTLEGYSAIKTINIENCPTVRSLDILGASTNVERVRLTNVNWTYDTAAEILALADRNLAGIDENGANIDKMWIDGKCHIKTLTGADYLKVKEAFPYLTITYDTLTAQLIFMSEDGNTELTRQTIQNGGNGTDPIDAGTIERPTKESTAQYHFTYSGWSLTPGGVANVNALKNVEADRIVYVSFAKELRSYTVRFYNGTTLLQTSTVQYGGDAVYSGSTPVNNSTGNPDDFEFYGWKPAPTNIQGATDCYAQFYDLREITDDWSTIAQACLDGTATEKYAIGAFKMLDIGEVSLPYEFNHGSAVLYNGEIHILSSVVSEYRTSHYKWDGTKWVEVSTLPYEFYYGSAVVFNGEIHILGGSGSSSGKKKHYKWNGSEWVSVSTLPYMFRNGVAVVYNNEIHIMGSEESSYYTSHYKWNGSSWSEVGELPYSFYTASGFIYNNEIHMLGSYDSKYNTAHYKYDGSSWISVSTLPQKLSNGHALVIGTDIYMIQWDEFYKYDGTNWDTCPNVPANVYEGGSVVLDGNIYVMGSSVSGNERVFYSYDTETSKWSKVGITETIPMEIIAHNHDELADGVGKWEGIAKPTNIPQYGCAVTYQNEVHALGGNSSSSYTKHIKWDATNSTWVTVSTLPYQFRSGCALVLNDEIHILGSYQTTNKTEHYKWNATDGWVSVDTLPYQFYCSSAVVLNNEIHILGSYDSSCRKYHYKWNGTEWTSVSTLPYNFYYGSAVVYNGEIHIFSGSGSSTGHYKWDGSAWTSVSTLPYDLQYGVATIINNEIHIFGGSDNETGHYKWDGTEWTSMTTLPGGFNNYPLAVCNGTPYIFISTSCYKLAGAEWNVVVEKNEAFRYGKWYVYDDTVYNVYNGVVSILNMDTYTKTSLPKLENYNTSHTTMAKYNGKIHAFSCVNQNAGTNYYHYIYDDANTTWIEQETRSANNYGCTVIVYNDKLYHFETFNGYKYTTYDDVNGWSDPITYNVLGSPSMICVYNNEIHMLTGASKAIYHYKFDGETFTKVCDLPCNMWEGHMLVCDGRLFVIGGKDKPYSVHEFDGSNWVLYQEDISKYYPKRSAVISPGASFTYRNKMYSFYTHAVLCRLENPRATLTFLAKNLLKDKIQYNTKAEHGWEISNLRKWMNETFIELVPEDLQNSIKPVIKMSDSGGYLEDSILINTTEWIWTPSVEELGASHEVSGQGEPYSVFTNAKSRIRLPLDGDTTTRYAVRSSAYATNHEAYVHECILTTGIFSFGSVTGKRNPLIGFCI